MSKSLQRALVRQRKREQKSRVSGAHHPEPIRHPSAPNAVPPTRDIQMSAAEVEGIRALVKEHQETKKALDDIDARFTNAVSSITQQHGVDKGAQVKVDFQRGVITVPNRSTLPNPNQERQTQPPPLEASPPPANGASSEPAPAPATAEAK